MKINKIFTVFMAMITLCCFAATSFAVLHPKYYAKRAKESKIKAIAQVKAVKVMDHHKAVDYKRVVFKLDKAFGKETPPQVFTGRCESVNKRFYERPPGVGGTIYYYPAKGERVYVTISDNDGSITSYTKLTPKLEKALRKNYKKVKIKMGTAYVNR
jgi:hypothetical protein